MNTITSADNRKVKELSALQDQAKERKKTGSFVIEGIRMFQDTPQEYIREAYISEGLYEKLSRSGKKEDEQLLAKAGACGGAILSPAAFSKASRTKTPQGILAVAAKPLWRLEDLTQGSPLLLLLEDIQDPGNLGTMFRTAEAAGASGIIMSRGTCDLFNPKTVRSTMTAIFREPFLYTEDLVGTIKILAQKGIRVFAALPGAKKSYDEEDYRQGTAILIGNEGNGLKRESAEAAAERILIPMEGKIESLNAAMSAGILLYEAYRQRRRK